MNRKEKVMICDEMTLTQLRPPTVIDHCLPSNNDNECPLQSQKGTSLVTNESASRASCTLSLRVPTSSFEHKNPAYGYIKQTSRPSTACSMATCCFNASCSALMSIPVNVADTSQTLPSRSRLQATVNCHHTMIGGRANTALTLPRLLKAATNEKRSSSVSSTPSSSCLQPCCSQTMATKTDRPFGLTGLGAKCDTNSRIKSKALRSANRRKTTRQTLAAQLAVNSHASQPKQVICEFDEAVTRLSAATASQPLDLVFVVMSSVGLRQTIESKANSNGLEPLAADQECRDCDQNEATILLPMGTLVTALFCRTLADTQTRVLFVKTPHGQEGFVDALACEPLSALPLSTSQHAASGSK